MVARPSPVRGGFYEIGQVSECAFLFRLHRGPEGAEEGNGKSHGDAHADLPSTRSAISFRMYRCLAEMRWNLGKLATKCLSHGRRSSGWEASSAQVVRHISMRFWLAVGWGRDQLVPVEVARLQGAGALPPSRHRARAASFQDAAKGAGTPIRRSRWTATTCSTPSRWAATWWRCAPTSPACWAEPPSCSSTPRTRSASAPAAPPRTGAITLEEAECLADCDRAPCVQVNHRLRRRPDPGVVRPADRRPAVRGPWPRHPPHGTLIRVRRTTASRPTRAGGRASGPPRPRPRRRAAGRAAAGGDRRGERPDGHHRPARRSSPPAWATTTRTRSSATWPPAATRACARRWP